MLQQVRRTKPALLEGGAILTITALPISNYRCCPTLMTKYQRHKGNAALTLWSPGVERNIGFLCTIIMSLGLRGLTNKLVSIDNKICIVNSFLIFQKFNIFVTFHYLI